MQRAAPTRRGRGRRAAEISTGTGSETFFSAPWRFDHNRVMADEIVPSSHFGHAKARADHASALVSAPRSDGAQEKANRGAGVGLGVALVLQVLRDQHGMAEVDQRDHPDPRGL